MTADGRSPIDEYVEVRPLLRLIRVMQRVMEWVDEDPETRKFYTPMYSAYVDILAEELAPHAANLAIAITELEDAFPEIRIADDCGA